MDKKTFIQALGLSLLIIGLWMGWNWWKERNTPPQQVDNTPAATQPTTNPAAATNPSTTNPATTTASAGGTNAGGDNGAAQRKLLANSAIQSPNKIFLGKATKDDPDYAMAVELTPEGAGVKSVTLNQFSRTAAAQYKDDTQALYHFQDIGAATGVSRAFATQKVIIGGDEIDLSSVRWEVEPSDADSVKFSIHIYRQSQRPGAAQPLMEPIAKITKTYSIYKRNVKEGSPGFESLGYELLIQQEIIDERPPGLATADARAIIGGPLAPPNEVDAGTDRAVVVGYKESHKETEPDPRKIKSALFLLGDFKPENSQSLNIEKADKFAWIGQASAYFAAIVMPVKWDDSNEPAPAGSSFKISAQAVAQPVDESGQPPTHSPTQLVSLAFETESPKIKMSVYLGPKARDLTNGRRQFNATPLLRNNHYSSFPRHYDLLLVSQGRMCFLPSSISCTSEYLTNGLVYILKFFHFLLNDWGLAIICLVLVVRALLHPITKRAQVKMMQMGKLAPEVEKLKKKFADKPEELNREMMKLYKAQGGAILGCLPMFLQTPIWISLWAALQGTFELRQMPFLYGWLHIGSFHWMNDLAKPDALIPFTYPGIPLYFFGWHMQAINLLPLLMAIVTYVNQKYFMPMPAAVTDEQKQQQKIQRGMTLLFPLMFYNLPSGLNLYYLTSMSLGILESKIIRKHIKKHEELEKLKGPELVPTKATRASRRAGDKIDVKKPEKPGMMERIMAWVQEKQEQAEQMRKERKKDKRK